MDVEAANQWVPSTLYQSGTARHLLAAFGAVACLFESGAALAQCTWAFAPAVRYAVGDQNERVDAVVVADFNGDGDLDLAEPVNFGSVVGVLLGNGDGTFQPVLRSPAGTSPRW